MESGKQAGRAGGGLGDLVLGGKISVCVGDCWGPWEKWWCLWWLLPFCQLTLMACSAPSTAVTFPGLGWQKAASLRTVYCSGCGHGGTVIKRQKAKTHNQIKQKAKRHAAVPTSIANTHELTLVFGSHQPGLVFQF